MREEVLKQRSFSTDKDRGRQIKAKEKRILQENDPSVNRVGGTSGAAHSVHARPNTRDDILCSPLLQKRKPKVPQQYPIVLNQKNKTNQTSLEQRKGRREEPSSVGYRSGNRETKVNASFDVRLNSGGGPSSKHRSNYRSALHYEII